jgi:uncharacterized RDD family membrane protein YckC
MSTNNTDNMELASMRSRAMAFIIDDFLITFLVLVVFWDNLASESTDLVALLTIMNEFVWPILFVKFLYQSFFVWYYGATVGKIITKIRVIDHDKLNRVSLFSAMLRSSGRIVSEMFFYIGFIIGFFNDGRQTFHDKIGRTLVVNV